jgi:hypothetical protein
LGFGLIVQTINFKYEFILFFTMVRGGSSKISSSPKPSYKIYLHEKPFFQYAVALIAIVALIVSVYGLVNTNKLEQDVVGDTISAEDFLGKLTAHDEMKAFVGVAPLNVIQINNNNLGNLQSQIAGLDISYIGSFLVQYTDGIVVYDYNNDEIKGVVNLQQPQAQLPADFFTKLNIHPELQGLQNQQPIGGQLDTTSLNSLKQQFPEVYANAKVGDFLLRYETRLVIYDYNADRIVNAVNLG